MKTNSEERIPHPRRWAKRAALTVASVVLCLGAVEGCCRLQGIVPFPRLTAGALFWQYDSELGWRHRPGHSDWFERADFRTHVSINEKGLRDGERSYARTGNRKRMLVIGDSFVWGYGVEKAARFTERIEARTGVEVINAGVAGYATDQELLWYRKEGVRYDVDHVLLVLCGDDHAQNSMERVFYVYGKPRFISDRDALVPTNIPVPETPVGLRFAHWVRCRSALVHMLTAAGPPRAPRGNSSGEFPPTLGLLREMRALAREQGSGFTIVIAARRWWGAPEDTPIEAFVDALRRDGFRVLDMEMAPGFEPDTMNMPANGHWNEVGHEFVANILMGIGGIVPTVTPPSRPDGR